LTVFKLAVLPSTLEAVAVALMAKWFLSFSWPWAFMLGYVVAPISPAVVIPSVLALQDQGYGTTTGIPSLMVAAAAIDDVLSLAGFGIFSALCFPGTLVNVPLWFTICSAPINYAIGFVAGLIAGLVMMLLLPKDEEYNPWWRAGWLLVLAVVLMKGLKDAHLSGASCLAVLVMCVVVVKVWGKEVSKPVSTHFTEIWNNLAQPLLFGLVGADVVVNDLRGEELLIAFGILAVSLSWRLLVTFCAVLGQGLRWQEQVFISVGWLPKATVQAAIGATALNLATDAEKPQGHLIFTVSVVAILLTAPAGAAIISPIGPALLQKDKEEIADGVGAPIIIPDLPSIRGALLSTDIASVRGNLKAADHHAGKTSLSEPIIEHWMDIFN
jgi:Kef-type K+ transport system membrane component KefB